jgi:hypothetical protein
MDDHGLAFSRAFAGATSIFPEDVVDVFKSLFEHDLMRLRAGESLFSWFAAHGW